MNTGSRGGFTKGVASLVRVFFATVVLASRVRGTGRIKPKGWLEG